MTKDNIINLWKLTDRPGINELITFLIDSDFFTAPCSVKHHLAKPGGLAEHSLNVYTLLSEKAQRFCIQAPHESVIICALGHDLCKVNFYIEGGEPCSKAQYDYLCSLWTHKEPVVSGKPEALLSLLEDNKFKRSIPAASATILIDWLKNNPRDPFPDMPIVYSVKDKTPLGHGEKSVSILQDFIKLTEVEKLAIRWHMGPWDISDYSGKWAFNNALTFSPLVALLITADFEAGSIIEKEEVDC